MPRIRPSLFWLARKVISPYAALLLQVCRDIPSTANELRWIREHVAATPSRLPPRLRFHQLCIQRARGVPLQYVLGTQPFGDLEILCRPGVLIPRPETEAYTLELASILLRDHKSAENKKNPSSSSSRPPLKILDVCTGTGCIALQLYASLCRHQSPSSSSPVQAHIQGIDISPHAISLARRNLHHHHHHHNNNTLLHNNNTLRHNNNNKNDHLQQEEGSKSRDHNNNASTIEFTLADLFSPDLIATLTAPGPGPGPATSHQDNHLDLLVSNPPYISTASFSSSTTARSVRNHEPRLALVPSQDAATVSRLRCRTEDVFYARLLEIARTLRPRRMLFEVADADQARRVVSMVKDDGQLESMFVRVEIWRDHPHAEYRDTDRVGETDVPVRGSGSVRAVYLCMGGLE